MRSSSGFFRSGLILLNHSHLLPTPLWFWNVKPEIVTGLPFVTILSRFSVSPALAGFSMSTEGLLKSCTSVSSAFLSRTATYKFYRFYKLSLVGFVYNEKKGIAAESRLAVERYLHDKHLSLAVGCRTLCGATVGLAMAMMAPREVGASGCPKCYRHHFLSLPFRYKPLLVCNVRTYLNSYIPMSIGFTATLPFSSFGPTYLLYVPLAGRMYSDG